MEQMELVQSPLTVDTHYAYTHTHTHMLDTKFCKFSSVLSFPPFLPTPSPSFVSFPSSHSPLPPRAEYSVLQWSLCFPCIPNLYWSAVITLLSSFSDSVLVSDYQLMKERNKGMVIYTRLIDVE